MKNFSIQSFTIMMMMMTVSSAAVVTTTVFSSAENITHFSQKELLKQIYPEASKVITNMSSEQKNTLVKFVGSGCTKEFFCLAKRSLNSTSLDVMDRLTGLVKEYNKVKNGNCTRVKSDHQMPLLKLVQTIENCAKINSK